MLGTNRELKTMQRRLLQQIAHREFVLRKSNDPAWVRSKLANLRRQAALIETALANRRLEAAQPVVDFYRWLDGAGALSERPVEVEVMLRALSHDTGEPPPRAG